MNIDNLKTKFISKWSSWWMLQKNGQELTWAFERELNEIIELSAKKEETDIDNYHLGFWYMTGGQTFIKLKGNNINDIRYQAREIAKVHHYGMLCPVSLMIGDKEVRRIGKSAHADAEGNIDIHEWVSELMKDETFRNLIKY